MSLVAAVLVMVVRGFRVVDGAVSRRFRMGAGNKRQRTESAAL